MTLVSAVLTSVGLLEMGGASAQVAFLPEGDPLANMFPVTLNGVDYKLYAHSYLAYGQDYSQQWQVQYLWQTQGGGSTVNHPCLFQGKCYLLFTLQKYKISTFISAIGHRFIFTDGCYGKTTEINMNTTLLSINVCLCFVYSELPLCPRL